MFLILFLFYCFLSSLPATAHWCCRGVWPAPSPLPSGRPEMQCAVPCCLSVQGEEKKPPKKHYNNVWKCACLHCSAPFSNWCATRNWYCVWECDTPWWRHPRWRPAEGARPPPPHGPPWRPSAKHWGHSVDTCTHTRLNFAGLWPIRTYNEKKEIILKKKIQSTQCVSKTYLITNVDIHAILQVVQRLL